MRNSHNNFEFLSGDGEMGKLIRSFDWSETSLGPIESWPQSLRTTLSIILNSAFPMFIWWGKDELINIYNDAYLPILGKKHPNALGRSGKNVWIEIWPDLAPLVDRVFSTGGSAFMKDLPLIMNRGGFNEQTYFTFSYSPIRDESGNIQGMFCACVETTEQVNTQNTLRLERERFRELFLNAPAAIAIVSGPDLVFQLANAPYRKLLGSDRPIDGMPLLQVIPEIDPALLEIVKNVAFKGERFIANELPVTLDWDLNGKPYAKYLNFIYEPIYEENDPSGLICFAYDVSDQINSRKRIEEQNKVLQIITSGGPLSEALDQLVSSVENQSKNEFKASVLLVDEDGKHLRHGAAPSLPQKYNEAIDGVAIGEAVGSCGTAAFRKKTVIVSDIESDPLWRDYKELAKKYDLKACWSSPIISSDNKVLGTFAVYYHQNHSPSTEEQQIIEFATRTAAIAIERKQHEKILRESEERFRGMADNIPNLAWMANPDGWIFWYNKRWYEYTGTTPSQMEGWGWQSVHDPKVLPVVMERWQESIQTKEVFEMIFPLKGADGIFRQFLTRVIPIKDEAGNVTNWFGTNTDVNKQKNIEEQLESLVTTRTKELMRKSSEVENQNKVLIEKNKELESFNYIASHDLQEPLRKIQTFTGMILEADGDKFSEESKNYFDRINSASGRMQSLIKALLDYSRVQASKLSLEKVDLNSVLDRVKEDLDELVKQEKVILTSSKLPIVNGIYVQLTQLFHNLIENSIKYRKLNVHPEVSISCTELRNLVINDRPKGDYWKVVFRDNGIGFNQNQAEAIFELFQRLHDRSAYEGTGIGLAICKKIVENHGGSILAKGELGKGSEFIILFPKF